MRVADRYRAFAKNEARGVSPRYEEFALGVSEDPVVLAFLETSPESKRQPNLLFAAVKYLTGVLPDYGALRDFVVGHQDELCELMVSRSTQTNEPGRCAALVPVLASLPQPVALLEAGAAAGLCLLSDCYAYEYNGRRVGSPDAPVVFPCETSGPVPIPARLPQIAWRRGLDLHPLDVADADTSAWLGALVWAGNEDREGRLRAALRVAAGEPPIVEPGDALDTLERMADGAPPGATLVSFHSAVMPYLRPEDRPRFATLMSSLPGAWVSFEGKGVLPDVDARLPAAAREAEGFVLALDGEPLALASPHGRWLTWFHV